MDLCLPNYLPNELAYQSSVRVVNLRVKRWYEVLVRIGQGLALRPYNMGNSPLLLVETSY